MLTDELIPVFSRIETKFHEFSLNNSEAFMSHKGRKITKIYWLNLDENIQQKPVKLQCTVLISVNETIAIIDLSPQKVIEAQFTCTKSPSL